MKIILSRKGFDSENGGMPSPIFPDGKMISLPIPTNEITSTVQINDLQFSGYNIAKVVSDLKGISANQYVHLDPDINYGILKDRLKDWRGAFGQVHAAQGHLANNGIGKGDLFIYFGWFREVEEVHGVWQFKKGAKNLHVIYGWLCVDEIISVKGNVQNILEKYPWLTNHPHLMGTWDNNNTIYIGSQSLPDTINGKESGFGVFDTLRDIQILTDTTQNNRTLWKLPASFFQTPLTYNPLKNWKEIEGEDSVHLRSASKGQEFILDTKEYPDINDWLKKLFAN
jgi:hypothetical protein